MVMFMVVDLSNWLGVEVFRHHRSYPVPDFAREGTWEPFGWDGGTQGTGRCLRSPRSTFQTKIEAHAGFWPKLTPIHSSWLSLSPVEVAHILFDVTIPEVRDEAKGAVNSRHDGCGVRRADSEESGAVGGRRLHVGKS
jgi:hypothetical protein